MKKITKAILSTSLLGFSMCSFADSPFYIGLGLSSGSAEEEFTASGFGSSTWDADHSQTQFILGFETSHDRRFEVSGNSVKLDGDDGTKEKYTGFDLDWYYTFGSQSIKPFFGLGLGFYNYEDSAEFTIENEDISGIAVNFSGGVLLPVHENVEIELAYKYKNISWQDLDVGFTTVEASTSLSSIAISGHIMF